MMLDTNIVIMVGLPASGKSSLVKEYENNGYSIISNDSNKTNIQSLIRKTNKIVVDNTNTKRELRESYIKLAHDNNLTVGVHYIDTNKDDCLINSLNRMYDRFGKVYMHVSDVPKDSKTKANDFVISAIFTLAKNFEKVSKTEGFDELLVTKFKKIDKYNYTNKAVFIDLDGTVRNSTGVEKYPVEFSDIEILKNSEEILKYYKSKGYKIIAVTNQSGISKKTVTSERVKELIEHTNKLLGGVIDDFYYCPHLPPKEVCYCRKPQSGVGVLMMHKHQLNLSECIMVGDSTSDKTFGTRLGMTYYRPDNFFKRTN